MRKILQIGNSWGITLDKEICTKMGIQLGTKVAISYDIRNGIIEITIPSYQTILNDAVAEIILRNPTMLERVRRENQIA